MKINLKPIIESKNWQLLNTLITENVISIDKKLILIICNMSCEDIWECLKVIPSLRCPIIDEKMLKWASSRTLYRYCYDFIGPNEEFKQALLNRKDSEYIYRYAKYIKRYHDDSIFNCLFLSEDSNYCHYIDYAKISGAPIEVMGEKVLDSNDAFMIKEFLEINVLIDYPSLVMRLLNKLKELNAHREIIDLIIKIDEDVFNDFCNSYLFSMYLNEICRLCSILSYDELQFLIDKLQTTRIITTINNVLADEKITINNPQGRIRRNPHENI